MIRAIQKFMKGERVYMPGDIIDETEFEDGEIQEMIETGYLAVKFEVEKKPPPPPKAKKGKGKKK